MPITEAHKLDDGTTVVKTEEVTTCTNCGEEVDAQEQANDTCFNCGEALNLKTSVSVWATSRPAGGKTLGQ